MVTSACSFYNNFQPAFVLFGEHVPVVFNHLVDIGLQVRTSQTTFRLAVKLRIGDFEATENQEILTNVVLGYNATSLLCSLLERFNCNVTETVHELGVADATVE
ncbi:hypothetical protein D3C75_933620 [compost metagenome]